MNLFKRNPVRKLQKLYENKLMDAVTAQREGRIQEHAELMAEADNLYQQLETLADSSTLNP